MRTINANKVIYKFEHGLEAIDTIKDGESVSLHTNDCFFQQVQDNEDLISEIDFGQVNPANGPFYVENAEVGDVLKVEILDIRVDDAGSIVVLPGGGALGDKVSKPLTRIVPVVDGEVDFLGIKKPIDPMIGVIGVSPGKDQEGVVTGTPGNHGGNMDTTDVRKGATLYFPVREKGAMLALGDCHAIMGDGELCVSGLEVQADVDLKVSVIKDKKINWPLLENETEVMVIASEETLDDAVVSAGYELTDYIQKVHDILWEEAYMFNSLFVDYKISQVVNPLKTVRAVVDKDILPIDKILA
ncbi:MAG TPA: acetamidase/formamidase family protein [Erysipelothrix sp.]|nr:acetamidase/formamidase family protein [Erysipelothrix sp.]